jgi:hypothetical protein
MADPRNFSSRAPGRAAPDTPSPPSRDDEVRVVSFTSLSGTWDEEEVSENDVGRSLQLALAARRMSRADELLKLLDGQTPDASEVGLMDSENDDQAGTDGSETPGTNSSTGSVRNFPKEKRSTAKTAMVLLADAQSLTAQAIKESEAEVLQLREDLEQRRQELETERTALKVATIDLETVRKRAAEMESLRRAAERDRDTLRKQAVADLEAAEKVRVTEVDKAIEMTQTAAKNSETELRKTLEISATEERANAIANAKGEVWRLVTTLLIGLGVATAVAHLFGFF